MSLHLHIERLVLDGLPIELSNASSIQTAVEAELARLFAEQGESPQRYVNTSVSRAKQGEIHIESAEVRVNLGKQIASAIQSAVFYAGCVQNGHPVRPLHSRIGKSDGVELSVRRRSALR